MKLNLAARWFVFGFLLLSIPPILALPAPAQIGVGISVRIGPPALPVYEQPLCRSRLPFYSGLLGLG